MTWNPIGSSVICGSPVMSQHLAYLPELKPRLDITHHHGFALSDTERQVKLAKM